MLDGDRVQSLFVTIDTMPGSDIHVALGLFPETTNNQPFYPMQVTFTNNILTYEKHQAVYVNPSDLDVNNSTGIAEYILVAKISGDDNASYEVIMTGFTDIIGEYSVCP